MKTYQLEVSKNGRVKAVLQFLRDQDIKNKTVLDVGSSFGWLAKELKNDKVKYIGVEPDEDSVRFAKKNISYAKFYQGFAEKLPIKSKSVDLVVFFDVIEHVHNVGKSLSEISRVLKPNGVLLLTTPFDHPVTKLTDPAWVLGHINRNSFLAKLFNPSWLLGHRHYGEKELNKLLKKERLNIEYFEVKGGLVSLVSMFWFYVNKWYLKGKTKSKVLEEMDDRSYQRKGIATVFLVAKKV